MAEVVNRLFFNNPKTNFAFLILSVFNQAK